MKKIITRISFLFISLFTLMSLSGCAKIMNADKVPYPINTDFFWDRVFVQPVAWLMKTIINNTGGYFWVGIILTTIIIRTILFPIYTKTNDTSLRMQQAQPEIKKLQEKYKGKTDTESRQKQQAELMQVYKKYNVNVLAGCLMPFLQMPVFMAMYHTVVKLPYTTGYKPDNLSFLWLTNDGLAGNDPYYILPILVAITAILLQFISMYGLSPEAKKNPSMKAMMYIMPGMMFLFSISQAAALSLYWITGNIFSTLQMIVVKKPFSKKEQ